MSAIRTVTFIIAIFFFGINVFGNDLSASAILKEVADSYKTIKAEGTITNETEDNVGKNGVQNFPFRFSLRSPICTLLP